MAFDEGLAERIRDVLADARGIEERRMFGGLAFMLRGDMFVGVVGSTLMARVGPIQYAAALRRSHAALASWIALCREFAATLPAKASKRKAR